MTVHSTPSHSYDFRDRRAQLLVVDDQPVNIHAIHQSFSADHDVFMATSGQQALAFCQKTPPDLVLLDVVMPDMDGLEVCRRLQQHPDTQNIPVVFVTSHSHHDEETACWEAGGVDFVNKPINPITLRNRVHAHLTLKFQADILRELAFVDGLTNIANRRLFNERVDAEWRRCSRSNSPLSLLMIDIDFFKRYNDHYGHQAGDDCLRLVAAALKTSLNRPFDLAARYGGEEFACLLPETHLIGAAITAETIEAAIRKLGIAHAASDAAHIVTASIGVAACYPNQRTTPAALLHTADTQLYLAKQQGRGRVCVEETSSTGT